MKYLQNRSGVRFAQQFLVGLLHGFLFRYWESVLGCRPRTERAKQPSQIHAGLRCVGNSSGDEANSPVIRDYDEARQRDRDARAHGRFQRLMSFFTRKV